MKKTIIRLQGGLGNQLFQYALALKLKRNNPSSSIYLDKEYFLRDKSRKCVIETYNLEIPFIKFVEGLVWQGVDILDIHGYIHSSALLKESDCFNKFNINEMYGRYICGSWQNYSVLSDVIEEMAVKLVHNDSNNYILEQYIKRIKNTNSVAIHIRKGDYASPTYSSLYVVQNKEYYSLAIEKIVQIVDTPVFYVFTDDSSYSKIILKTFEEKYEIHFLCEELRCSDTIEFEIMRCCKHFIISNSTFSWWAAQLNLHPQKIIIAPSNWFYDDTLNKKCIDNLLTDKIII